MPRKPYTHKQGFNVTPLKGRVGAYIFVGDHGFVQYIGSCDDERKTTKHDQDPNFNQWKARLGSHGATKEFLTDDIHSMYVIIAPFIRDYLVDVLEYLLKSHIGAASDFGKQTKYFGWIHSDEEKIEIAKKHGLHIKEATVKDFLLNCDVIYLQRERDKYSNYVTHGEILRYVHTKVKGLECTGFKNLL